MIPCQYLLLLYSSVLFWTNYAVGAPTEVKDSVNPLSKDGSTTVQWLEGETVIIRNFHVRSDGTLMVSAFDGSSWTTSATPVSGIETDDPHKAGPFSFTQSSISAVRVNTGTNDQEIHVFYPTGNNQVMQSMVWNVAANTWSPDSAFNNQKFVGNPRAAITWTDTTGVVNFRVYFVQYTNEGGSPTAIPCNLWEIQGVNGVWQLSNDGQPIVAKYFQNGGTFSDAVAALTWISQDPQQMGRQVRVYVYQGLWLQEYIFVDGTGWIQGADFSGGFQDQTRRYPVTAVQFFASPSGNNLRIYRNTYLPLGKNVVNEWAYDQGSGKWRRNDLPAGIISNTDGSMQSSSIAWTYPDESQVHIRLYQNRDKDDSGNAGLWIEESSFDTGNGWTANTGTIDGSVSSGGQQVLVS